MSVVDELLALEDEVNGHALEVVELRPMAHALDQLRRAVAEVDRRAAHDAAPLTAKKQLWADREAAAAAKNARRHAAAAAEQADREAAGSEAGHARAEATEANRQARDAR